MLADRAVMREIDVFRTRTLPWTSAGSILGLKTLGFNGEAHHDLIEQGVRFTLRHGTSLPFDMILHGLGHQLVEMTPGAAVRNPSYDVVDHLELAVDDVHGNKAQPHVLEFTKVAINVLVIL